MRCTALDLSQTYSEPVAQRGKCGLNVSDRDTQRGTYVLNHPSAIHDGELGGLQARVSGLLNSHGRCFNCLIKDGLRC